MSLPKLFFVGVKGLIRNSSGDILLLLSNVTAARDGVEPYWDLPGGRIEEGDDEEKTLRREVLEETGIDNLGEITYLDTVISSHSMPIKDSDRAAGLVLRIWQVTLPKTRAITISDEHIRYEWVAPSKAAVHLSHKYPEDFCKIIANL